MYHRMVSGTGLGNPNPPQLTNNWTEDKKKNTVLKQLFTEAANLYFREYGGLDFEITSDSISFGIEPPYQYDKLKIICISKDKELSYIQSGIAWGVYGSNIVKKTNYYKDYKNKGKFVKFIDKWHDQLNTIFE